MNKLKTKPFDLEAAKRGEPVVTRYGKRALLVNPDCGGVFRVCFSINGSHDYFKNNGKCGIDDNDHASDLFMVDQSPAEEPKLTAKDFASQTPMQFWKNKAVEQTMRAEDLPKDELVWVVEEGKRIAAFMDRMAAKYYVQLFDEKIERGETDVHGIMLETDYLKQKRLKEQKRSGKIWVYLNKWSGKLHASVLSDIISDDVKLIAIVPFNEGDGL